MRRSLLLAAVALLGAVPAHAADDAATRKILQAVADKNAAGFQAGQSTTVITLTLASGKSKTWTTLARVLRGQDGHLKTRVTFLEPADSVGTELLIVEAAKGPPAQYLWLPKTKRLRRIGGSQRNEAFMGTDFSFGDLEGRGMQTGEAKRLGNEAVNGVSCAKIEVAITDAEDVYGKVLLWVDEQLSVARKIQFFDKTTTLVKTLDVEQVRPLAGGRALMESFKMTNHLRNSVTRVQTRNLDTKAALPETLFVPEALGK